MSAGPMVHLTTVGGAFHGRVVAARLGAEGIFAELRGAVDGPYPAVGVVDVFVQEDQADAARQILLADAVDAAFDDGYDDPEDEPHDLAPARITERWWRLSLAIAVLVLLTTLVATRGL